VGGAQLGSEIGDAFLGGALLRASRSQVRMCLSHGLGRLIQTRIGRLDLLLQQRLLVGRHSF